MTPRFRSRKPPRFLSVSLALLGAISLSCSDSEGPTAPRTLGTAAISGTLLDSDTARPLPDVAVSVARSTASTRTDASGSFSLSGVPAGAVLLELRGNGLRATASVTASAGTTARVTITVSQSRATTTVLPRSEGVALEGTVLSLNPAASSFVLQTGKGPVTIRTDASTVFRKGDAPAAFSDLEIGEEVYLYGTTQEDGSVLAVKVYIAVLRPTPTPTRTEGPPPPTRTESTRTPSPTPTKNAEVALFGTVDSIDCGKGTFLLKTELGVSTIQTNAGTVFQKNDLPATCADLVAGGQAYVLGTKQDDGSVLASKVLIVPPRPTPTVTPTRTEQTPTPSVTPTPNTQVTLFGTVDGINAGAGTFLLVTELGTFTIQTNGSTGFRKNDLPATFADLVGGGKAYVVGKRQEGGVLATTVYIVTPTPTPTKTPTRTEETATPSVTPTRTEKTPTPTPTKTAV